MGRDSDVPHSWSDDILDGEELLEDASSEFGAEGEKERLLHGRRGLERALCSGVAESPMFLPHGLLRK